MNIKKIALLAMCVGLSVSSSTFSMKKEENLKKIVQKIRDLRQKESREEAKFAPKSRIMHPGVYEYSEVKAPGFMLSKKSSYVWFMHGHTHPFVKAKKGAEKLIKIRQNLFNLKSKLSKLIPEKEKKKYIQVMEDSNKLRTLTKELTYKEYIEKLEETLARYGVTPTISDTLYITDILGSLNAAWDDLHNIIKVGFEKKYGKDMKNFLIAEEKWKKIQAEKKSEEKKEKIIPKDMKSKIIKAVEKSTQAKCKIEKINKKIKYYTDNWWLGFWERKAYNQFNKYYNPLNPVQIQKNAGRSDDLLEILKKDLDLWRNIRNNAAKVIKGIEKEYKTKEVQKIINLVKPILYNIFSIESQIKDLQWKIEVARHELKVTYGELVEIVDKHRLDKYKRTLGLRGTLGGAVAFEEYKPIIKNVDKYYSIFVEKNKYYSKFVEIDTYDKYNEKVSLKGLIEEMIELKKKSTTLRENLKKIEDKIKAEANPEEENVPK